MENVFLGNLFCECLFRFLFFSKGRCASHASSHFSHSCLANVPREATRADLAHLFLKYGQVLEVVPRGTGTFSPHIFSDFPTSVAFFIVSDSLPWVFSFQSLDRAGVWVQFQFLLPFYLRTASRKIDPYAIVLQVGMWCL